METLVATIIIVIVFLMTSMILNNLFEASIKNNHNEMEAKLNELHYLYINKKLKLPHYNNFNQWKISIEKFKDGNKMIIEFEAYNVESKKTINRHHFEVN